MSVKPDCCYFVVRVLFLISTFLTGTFAQSRYDASFNEVAGGCTENLVVFTDRSLYAVNETIRFSGLLSSWLDSYPEGGSKIVYAELVSPEGKAVAKGKYPVHDGRASGALSIPSDIFSGTCYLRFYTRWMRNFGKAGFTYIPLTIVNPFSGEVGVIDNVSSGNSLTTNNTGNKKIVIQLPLQTIEKGAVVAGAVSTLPGHNDGIKYGCITAVPRGAVDTSLLEYRVHSEENGPLPFHFEFLPELNGAVISGETEDPAGRGPVAGSRIHFSFLDRDPAYFVTRADENGRFSVSTPAYEGTRELYVVAESPSGLPQEFRLDSDYAPEGLPFKPAAFNMPEEQQRLASGIALQMQLNRAYLEETANRDSVSAEDRYNGPDFGGERISVRLDEFIQLPNLEEVIQNLIPDTYILGREGNRRIQIKGDNPMISLYPRLLMVDHLPVLDLETFLSISPDKIDRIDVVPEVCVKGDARYGGMISIITKEGDFGGIRLPGESSFFDFEFVKNTQVPLLPVVSGSGKIPDTRNTLFWSDRIEFEAGDTFRFEFSAPGLPGTYLVLFRGVTSDGERMYGWNQFEVQ